jgi:uncharacterized protein
MHSPPALQPLEPGQRWVMYLESLPIAIAMVAGGTGIGFALREGLGTPFWMLLPAVVPVALWLALIAPWRRFLAWGWALEDEELHVAWGIWTQVHTIVPLGRVQHLDVAQGPVERAFGVARLIVHTAGTAHSTVTLPGLRRDTAERLRDTIRQHIRSDPW